jgi:Tol biopolymer transport system component
MEGIIKIDRGNIEAVFVWKIGFWFTIVLAGVLTITLLVMSKPRPIETEPLDGELGIAFYHSEQSEEPGKLYWMRVDGTDIQPLYDHTTLEGRHNRALFNARIAPDGQHILFSSEAPDTFNHEFFITNADDSQISSLPVNPGFEWFAWSEDSKDFAYMTRNEIHVVDVERLQDKIAITTNEFQNVLRYPEFTHEDSIVWSPDNHTMAFINTVGQSGPYFGTYDFSIFTFDLRTHRLRQVLPEGGPYSHAYALTWSTESLLYYACLSASGQIAGICALDLARSVHVRVSDLGSSLPPNTNIRTLDATPDGQIVIGVNDGYGSDDLYIYDVENDRLSNISSVQGSYPHWFYLNW